MGTYSGYGYGNGMGNGIRASMPAQMGPYMSDEFQQAGGYGGGMASNGVMPAGNFQGGFSGYGGRLNQPWEVSQANMDKYMQSMFAPTQRQNNAAYLQRGQGMAANNPDQYAKLQAIVAANHPGWNQNRIDQRAAFRLGKRGM